MKFGKIFKFITFLLFFIFLFWPLYVILFYLNFDTKLRFFLSISMFFIEIILGIVCIFWSFLSLKKKKSVGNILFFSLICFCFLGYVISLILTYLIK